MSHAQPIVGAIREAMSAACSDAFTFTGSLTEKIAAEYLLTVHVARHIDELNQSFATPYEIRIECPTRKFAADCVPLMKKVPASNFLGHRHIPRGKINTPLRNGRIDVAVYTGGAPSESPICAIELKGFNPSNSTVLTDLKRNAAFFSLTGPTGGSTIAFAVFGALHSVRKLAQIDKPDENLRKTKERYSKLLAQLNKPDLYLPEVETFSVRHQSQRDAIDADDVPDFASEDNHHFIGALVVFTAKPTGGSMSTTTSVQPS
jgi:hypothetical protein